LEAGDNLIFSVFLKRLIMNKILLMVGMALIGLMVSFAQFAPIAAAQDVTQDIENGLCSGANLQITSSPTNCQANSDALDKVSRIIRRIVNLLSVIVGVVAVIMIIVGGLRYVTSGGSDSSVTGAKNTILYAIIGLIIVALAQVLVHFVLSNLSAS
jgi:beta-lactamase regulating signal transducer with metallopeptidase domain